MPDTQARGLKIYKALVENMINGCIHCEGVYDDAGKMIDWRYVLVNPAFEKITGLRNVQGRLASEVIHNVLETNPGLLIAYAYVAGGGGKQTFDEYFPYMNVWLRLSIYSVAEGTFTVISENITERKEKYLELQKANEEILVAWGKTLEFRDADTEAHAQRVTQLTMRFAQSLGISGEELLNIRRGALLHDIGKIMIPDALLHYHGALTAEQYEIVKKHSQYAYDVLYPIHYLRPAIDIPYSHHEKWDGTGYPLGLKESEIPLAARLFSIVDVYDAMTNDRPYRDALPQKLVLDHLENEAGKSFEPMLVKLFVEMVEVVQDG